MTTPIEALARAWADLPAQLQAHPGIKNLHRAALAQTSAPSAEPHDRDRLRQQLRADLAIESMAVDDLLQSMGQDSEAFRTEGGVINRLRLIAWLKDRAATTAPAPLPAVDDLAQFIRSVNGNNSMGAGALAEKIADWIESRAAPLIANGLTPQETTATASVAGLGEPPALDWPQMLLLINAYAGHVADAAQHQAASRADISQAAALKALTDIRMAMAAHTSRWQALAHELIWRTSAQAVAPHPGVPLTDGQIDALWSDACRPDRATRPMVRAFARAVLREAGITAEPTKE